MTMPWQLKKGLEERRCSGRTTPRPIAEQLPSITVKSLKIPSPYDSKTYILDTSFRYPEFIHARVNNRVVEFRWKPLHRGDPHHVETFKVKPIKTGFGIRYALHCHQCGRAVTKLYIQHRHIACRRCHNAIYASQAITPRLRPALQASRIESFLGNKTRLFRHVQERLTRKLGEKLMRAQGRMGTQARSLWE